MQVLMQVFFNSGTTEPGCSVAEHPGMEEPTIMFIFDKVILVVRVFWVRKIKRILFSLLKILTACAQ